MEQIGPQQKYRLGTISYIKLLSGFNRFYRRLTLRLFIANLTGMDYHLLKQEGYPNGHIISMYNTDAIEGKYEFVFIFGCPLV